MLPVFFLFFAQALVRCTCSCNFLVNLIRESRTENGVAVRVHRRSGVRSDCWTAVSIKSTQQIHTPKGLWVNKLLKKLD